MSFSLPPFCSLPPTPPPPPSLSPFSILNTQLTSPSFTARGIVALVFSIIAGLLGVAVVAWYGLATVSDDIMEGARHRIVESDLTAPENETAAPAAGTTAATTTAAPVAESKG